MPDHVRFYSRDNLPPVIKVDASNKKEAVYDWDYNDDQRCFEPVLVGYRDPQGEIDAVKYETLAQMLERMPGDNQLDKLKFAVKNGVVPLSPEDNTGAITDLTGLPQDLIEAKEAIAKAKQAEEELPEEIKTAEGKNSIEKIINYFNAKLAEAKAAEKPVSEGDKKQ